MGLFKKRPSLELPVRTSLKTDRLQKSMSGSEIIDPRKAMAMATHCSISQTNNIHGNGHTNGYSNGHNKNGHINGCSGNNGYKEERVSAINYEKKDSADKKTNFKILGAAFWGSSSTDKKKKQQEKSPPTSIDTKLKMYHWQAAGGKSTVDDMVLLSRLNNEAITDNLKKRFYEDKIYTYIGPVLVAVNPLKELRCYGDNEVRQYQGAAQYEVPPHIYALADSMYRNMMIDAESQCVIISGESGAGKTVSAKYIMHYITQVSGGGARLQHVKEVILSSNPLLEAFGNAKTSRNNNSSRFGKYIEIEFSSGGEPHGGRVTNFLLEKSRVHSLNKMERNFHIFYQLCAGATPAMQDLGIAAPEFFHYLSQSSVTSVPGVDDAKDFQETLHAMSVMGLSEAQKLDILRVVAAVMHLSNVTFDEPNNNAVVADSTFLEYPAFLMGISSAMLGQKLISRVMDGRWGGKQDIIEVTFNKEKAQFARDAWAKGLYSRLFEYIIKVVNEAMATESKGLNLGILDIYGFEVFDRNGFEQFCINYVNEKLQQIFIELTLKSEQEEYETEGIEWTPIDFFNNAVVCELIESRQQPVGIMCVLDDTCATMSAVTQGADENFKRKCDTQVGNHPHYQPFRNGFTIRHYAGDVSYHVEGFCEKNRDVLNADIIEAMQLSSNAFIRSLFPENVAEAARGRPTTSGSKIRAQANELVKTLVKCVPHYIRCMKPNDTKKAGDWDHDRVKHQVEYLGLKENIKVKRAGFVYRRPFHKFLSRYAILTKETWPRWDGDPVQGVRLIMRETNLDAGQFQTGKTKVFVRDPESLYMLEESRERRYDHYARIIQAAFRKHYCKQRSESEAEVAAALLGGQKERGRHSLRRTFRGDYLGATLRPGLMALLGRRDKVLFSISVFKYTRRFVAQRRDLLVTSQRLLLVGRERSRSGPDKGVIKEVVKRAVAIKDITQVSLSMWQDDMLLLSVYNDYASLLQVPLKTELLLVLHRAMLALSSTPLQVTCCNTLSYSVRKVGMFGGAARKVVFHSNGNSDLPVLTSTGGTLTVSVARGLPATMRPADFVRSPDLIGEYVDGPPRNSAKVNIYPHNPKTQPNMKITNSASNSPQKSPFTSRVQDTVKALGNSTGKGVSNLRQQVSNRLNQNQIKLSPGANNEVPPPPPESAPQDQPNIRGIPKKLPPKPVLKPKVRALYKYDAQDAEELTFDEGDVFELITEHPSGWWTCRINGKQGFCPWNYLEKV